MSWSLRIFLGILLAVVIVLAGLRLFRTQIAERVLDRAIETRVGTDPSASLPDGLHVYLCGTGSPFPDPERAGPCVGILAGETGLVFDTGSGSPRQLASMGFPAEKLDAVFLTHLHSDHIDGLGELLLQAWIGASRDTPLPVHGPVGTSRVVDGFNMAYQIDSTYRLAHHGPEVANLDGFGGIATEFVLPAGPAGSDIVYRNGDVTVTAVRVDHSPVEPAAGYRIDYKDRSVVISGDTVYSPAFVGLSKGADLMLHEALQPEIVRRMVRSADANGADALAKVFTDILDYHTTPADAARAAEEAGVGELVLVHIVPILPSRSLYPIFLGDAGKAFSGRLRVGEDGMMFSLPSGTEALTMRKIDR